MIVMVVVDLEHQVKCVLTSDFSTVNLLFLSLLKWSAFYKRKALPSLHLKMESYNVAGELKRKKVVWNSEKDLSICPLELITLRVLWFHACSLCFNILPYFMFFYFFYLKPF